MSWDCLTYILSMVLLFRWQMEFSCWCRFARCQCNKNHLNRCHYVFANHMANSGCFVYMQWMNMLVHVHCLLVEWFAKSTCVNGDIHGKIAIQLSSHFIFTKQIVFNICLKECTLHARTHAHTRMHAFPFSISFTIKSKFDLHSMHLFNISKCKSIRLHREKNSQQLLIDIIII